MHFQTITDFSLIFKPFKETGLIAKAIENSIIKISELEIRDFGINKHNQIDDTPYGGGTGMLLRPEPAYHAIKQAKQNDPNAIVIAFSPSAKKLEQKTIKDLTEKQRSKNSGFIFLCNRYEGVDERILENYVDYTFSLGDFILMGSEVAAMSFIEASSRLLPGAIGNQNSVIEESFSSNLLEHSQYTKPQEFLDHQVPEILTSGDHQKIDNWKKENALIKTAKNRPDLLSLQDVPFGNLSVALVHFPVKNKNGEIITSSITNIDIHDIARSAKTFGIKNFYVVHPTKAMQLLIGKIAEHWNTGYGSVFNPKRKMALSTMKMVNDIDEIFSDIKESEGINPKLVVTSAQKYPNSISNLELKSKIFSEKQHYVLVLGTGWGLAEKVVQKADYVLEPILGRGDYNHLSVRAAAAIMFSRVMG